MGQVPAYITKLDKKVALINIETTLRCIQNDAHGALDGSWLKTESGFKAQIESTQSALFSVELLRIAAEREGTNVKECTERIGDTAATAEANKNGT